MSALSATDKRFELQQKLKARQAGPEDPTMSSAEQKELLEKRLLEITNEETRMNEKDKTWDSDAKVFKAAVSDDTIKAAPIKLCKTVDMKMEGTMSDSEKAKLSAMIGSAHAQSMKAYSNQSDVNSDITEAECSAQTTLVFNGCSDSNYTLKAYAAKIFIQNCENVSITLSSKSKVLTETVEVHRCVETKLSISSRIGTLQMDQCIDCEANFSSNEVFGNPSMIRKGREFGKDGRVVWAGCENLVVNIGKDKIVGDFETEKKSDLTINSERTQFKVSYDARSILRSEKVIRLRNGFPSTKREDNDHDRREEAALQGLAERMGVTLNRKEDTVGKKFKPNEPCPCGSGKKYKKCCNKC